MKQAILAWHKFNKSTKGHNVLYLPSINLSNFGLRNNALYSAYRSVHRVLVIGEDIYFAHIILFLNNNGSSSIFLNLLDHLPTRPNNRSDKFFRNGDIKGSWRMRLQLRSWLSQCLGDFF